MKKKNYDQRREEIMQCMVSIPRRMVDLHGIDNMAEFVLYHLSDQRCFNLVKAAFFIDNPEFNVLRGIAGVSQQEMFQHKDHWNHYDNFTQHMKNAVYHNQIRAHEQVSAHKNNIAPDLLKKSVADKFDFQKSEHKKWKMKHENHGLLVFELADETEKELIEENLENGLYLLSFCPVY